MSGPIIIIIGRLIDKAAQSARDLFAELVRRVATPDP